MTKELKNTFDRTEGNLIPVTRDKLEPVLFGIYKGDGIRTIAKDIGKSIRTVQDVLAQLEEKKYIINKTVANGKKGGRFLTEKGKEFLRHVGHIIP